MITTQLSGGLGNKMFQLAGLDTISKQTNRTPYLTSIVTEKTHHSSKNYFDSIFSNWRSSIVLQLPAQKIEEPSYEFREWKIEKSGPVMLAGYFQNYRYVSNEFESKLSFPECPELPGAFLHIRGGDYVNHWLHHVDLRNYYHRAIERFPHGTKFFVFTNDKEYVKSLDILEKIDYEFIDEPDELTALTLMKNCKVGGICANSTFSWWAAYLNRQNRTLVLPSKWFNSDIYIEGYFFPEAIICQV